MVIVYCEDIIHNILIFSDSFICELDKLAAVLLSLLNVQQCYAVSLFPGKQLFRFCLQYTLTATAHLLCNFQVGLLLVFSAL